MSKILIANRGEIALRIARTARELGHPTITVFAADDAQSPHVPAGDESVELPGTGPAAYLDQDAILRAALDAGAELILPGYGFLSENATFAQSCHDAGIVFAGPSPAVLARFGDKTAARAAAITAGVPVLDATAHACSFEEAAAFLDRHPDGIMIKAVAGGGGRGMRVVTSAAQLPEAYTRAGAEAKVGFGVADVFAEQLLTDARHIEVQIVAGTTGSGRSAACAVGDRDCSIQRRHQKIIEIAPAPGLSDTLRASLHSAAARLCAAADYRGLATVEFLVSGEEFYFLEVNPRIQVEHTITEETAGIDLVEIQIALANGTPITELDLPSGVMSDGIGESGSPAMATGIAIQTRINAESVQVDGTAIPHGGTITDFVPPTGRGVRVDTAIRPGFTVGTSYDSLLAKVITHTRTPLLEASVVKAAHALEEFTIRGITTNIDLLRETLADPRLVKGELTTSFLDDILATHSPAPTKLGDSRSITTPMPGTVVEAPVTGSTIPAGGQVAVIEAMKMQHVITAPTGVRIEQSLVSAGQTVTEGTVLAHVVPTDGVETADDGESVDLDRMRADLQEVLDRHGLTLDDARPDAVAKRRRIGRRTARENIADLIDEGSFLEYGALAIAAQRARRSDEDLITNTPADGLIGGVATIGASEFGAAQSEAVVMSYDYTVMAGTQGMRGHHKTDRLLDIASRKNVPVVLFAEGGGGRPGDTDHATVSGLELTTFRAFGALKGRVPLVAVVSGRCFAGNAALAGAADVRIATPDANIGMGGPAMIEGGGLGVVRPEDIGPIDVQRRNGVIDLVAGDDAHAVDLVRRYLSYFRGPVAHWTAPDPRVARHVVPENRLRAYDVRTAIAAIADEDSVLELRRDFGKGIVTALVRVEGVPYGLFANSTEHLGGAIDGDGADKLGEFLTLCNNFGLPIVSLCDTPGFMVGPDAEHDAIVRRFGQLFGIGARLRVPFGMVILRKGYGLGAMAMAGGSFAAPLFTVAWPTGEIGGMGLEGAVRLGFGKQLDAITDPDEREKTFQNMVAMAYQLGRGLTAATMFELDDVIDPAETRSWIRQLHRP